MVQIDLTKKEIIMIKGALTISNTDEFGNKTEIAIVDDLENLQKKLSKAWLS